MQGRTQPDKEMAGRIVNVGCETELGYKIDALSRSFNLSENHIRKC